MGKPVVGYSYSYGGYGYGYGDGYGDGNGNGYGDGYGYGNGYGYGDGYGYGYGYGDGYGNGYGYGYGDGNGATKLPANLTNVGEHKASHGFGLIQIGCQVLPVEVWVKRWARLAWAHELNVSKVDVETILKIVRGEENE